MNPFPLAEEIYPKVLLENFTQVDLKLKSQI